MDYSSLFALPDGVEVAETSVTGSVLTLSLIATAPTAMCPLCGQASQRIRSSYTRHVADVPSAGRRVQLVLRVRKFHRDTDEQLELLRADTHTSRPQLSSSDLNLVSLL